MIKIRNLWKSFGKLQVLKGINIDIDVLVFSCSDGKIFTNAGK